MKSEQLQIVGSVKIFADSKLVYESGNLVTNVGRSMLISTLTSESGEDGQNTLIDARIKYMAIGDGTGAPADVDTALSNERLRVSVDSVFSPLVGARLFVGFFAAPQINITEFGLFGGPNATAVSGSGILFNRAKLNFNNVSGASDVSVHSQLVLTTS